jgi:cysteine desulfurase
MKHIFLDYNSTTPTDPLVINEMLPYFNEKYGNPASRNHGFGIEAKAAVADARKQIAQLINCNPKEIYFTSGATEAINLALKGLFESGFSDIKKYVTIPIEHKAVLDSLKYLKNKGLDIQVTGVNRDGLVNINAIAEILSQNANSLVIIMHANNEIGVVQPIPDISKIVKESDSYLFVDGAQSVGKIPIDVKELGIDMMAISAHKFYGPKGVGALYINRESKLQIASQIDGGGHESGLRSGTLNVPSIVGFGKAAELAKSRLYKDTLKITKLRDMLLNELQANIDGITINGSMDARIPNNLNISFSGLDGDSLLVNIDDIAISNGAACSSSKNEPSYVLKALGIDNKLAKASIRFGIGRNTTEEEIKYTVNKFKDVVKNLRSIEELKAELTM